MIEINFKYKKQNNIKKCKEDDFISDICEQFKKNINNKKIIFIYDDMIINSEINMTVGALLFQENKKKKKKYEINVYTEPIQIRFIYSSKDIYLKISEDEKIESILKRFAKEINKDLNSIYFLYGGEKINEDKYNFTFGNFSSEIDQEENSMSIIVYDADSLSKQSTIKNESIINNSIINDDIEMPNNIRENLIIQNIDPEILEQRKFYLHLFTILLIQYMCAALFSWLGFYLKFNEPFIKDKKAMKIGLVSVIITNLFMAIIAKEVLKKYSKSPYLIFYQIFSGFFIIYFCFLLSKFFEYKYIIISLSLILTELLAMEFQVLLFKNYNILLFIMSFSILSSIGLILFSVFWINELIPIIYILIFWIFSMAYVFLNIYILSKNCKSDEYFYACIVFNYGIFLLIALGLKYIFNIIKSKTNNFEYDVIFQLKLYSIFIIQNIIIILFIYVGFRLKWNYLVIGSWHSFKCFLIPTIIIHFIFCFLAFLCGFTFAEEFLTLCYICIVMYIPFMIIFSFIFSYFILPKFILALMIILLLNSIAIVLFMLLFNSIHPCGLFLFSLIMNAVSLILFHYLWLESKNAIIVNSVVPFVNLLIWILTSFFISERNSLPEESYIFFLLFFNYLIFIVVYALSLALVALALGIVVGILAFIIMIFAVCSGK